MVTEEEAKKIIEDQDIRDIAYGRAILDFLRFKTIPYTEEEIIKLSENAERIIKKCIEDKEFSKKVHYF